MPFLCIPGENLTKFREEIKSRKLDILDLIKKDSSEISKIFEKYAGDPKIAKDMTTLFEEKIILKNRLQGMKNFVSRVGELGRYDPTKKAEIAKALKEYRKIQQERILSPKENQGFLSNLAEKMLGTEVTRAEAKVIFDIQTKIDNIRIKSFDETTERWTNQKDAIEYGMQKALLGDHLAEMNGVFYPLKDLLRSRYSEFKQQWRDNKAEAAFNIFKDALKQLRNNAVSLIASIDNSFQFRQGFSVLVNKPDIWKKGFKKSWSDMYYTIKGKDLSVRAAIQAEVYSRSNNIMGRDKIAGILGGAEEQFPTSLPGRIPVLGLFFKASENAFNGSALRMRLGLFDHFLKVQELSGADIDDPMVIKSAGQLALQMTARSKLGKTGSVLLNHYLLWAPRLVRSAWDTLILPVSPGVSPFVRRQAAFNLLRLIAVIGVTKAVANAVIPGSVTVDPRSSDFKNIKVGNTRTTFGIGEMSLVTLGSRLVPTMHNGEWGFWVINSKGIYQKFGGKYGQASPFDIAVKFLEGKASPFPAKILIDYLNQTMFGGGKPTIAREAAALSTPISIQNAIQLKDEFSLSAVIGVISDGLGFSANTYNVLKTDWSQKQGVELQQFREKVGEASFKEANNRYNQEYEAWFKRTINDSKYKLLSDEEKQKLLTEGKDEIKNNIFKRYNFIYQQPEKKISPASSLLPSKNY